MNTSFKMWSLYPFISRDISVWAGEEDGEKLKKIIKENATELLIQDPYVFDSFKKPARPGGGEDKISYAFRLVFQSMDRIIWSGRFLTTRAMKRWEIFVMILRWYFFPTTVSV